MPAKTMIVCGLMLLAATLTLKARGPIENPGMKVAVDEQGVQARGYTFRNECQKSSPWRAKWIWINGRLVSRGPVDMGKDFAGGGTRRRRHQCRRLDQRHDHATVTAAPTRPTMARPSAATVKATGSRFPGCIGIPPSIPT